MMSVPTTSTSTMVANLSPSGGISRRSWTHNSGILWQVSARENHMIYSRDGPDKPVSKSLQSKQPDHHSEQSWSCRTNTATTLSLMSSSEDNSARAQTPCLLNLTWPFRYWNRMRYCSRMCRLKLLSLSCKSISCRWRDEHAHEEACPEHKLFGFFWSLKVFFTFSLVKNLAK